MVRCVFTDFDEFADSIKGLNGRYIPTARSTQQWWIDPVRIGSLTLQQLQIGGASTFAGTGQANELCVGMPISDPAAISIDGEVLTPNSLITIRHNRGLTSSAQTPSRWAGMTLPLSVATDSYFDNAEELDAAMRGDTHVHADPASLRRVALLIALLCSGNQSINIVDSASLAAAQEEVVIAVRELLRTGNSIVKEGQRLGRPPVARDKIIARCLEYFRENSGQPILVSDLCRIAQVSERTLRNIFYEYVGVGPVRFLKVRQLQEVRSALLTAGDAGQSVTSIATRFGVWDFSLFARNYRALYGETPSQTLRGARPRNGLPPNRTSLDALQSWMNHASRRFEQAAAASQADLR